MIQIYAFDTFEYSVAVLFVIFMLIVFIGILWYNTLHRQIIVDISQNNNNNHNNIKCITQPNKLLGDTKFY
jgi:hypothetical protein